MKKIMICMAFFGMLIGNGHAGATDNATELLNALNTANVGNILDKLTKLNTDATAGAVVASAVEADKDGAYKDLSGKLTDAGITYDNTDTKYYLRDTDKFSDYIKTKLKTEIDTIKYESIIEIHGNTVYKLGKTKTFERVENDKNCKSGQQTALRKSICTLFDEMEQSIATVRGDLLKELLKEKMVAEIKGAVTYENIIDYDHVKQHAKGEVEEIIDNKIKAPVVPLGAVDTISTALKGEVDDALLVNVYTNAIKDKTIKDKRQKLLKELLKEKMKKHIDGLTICEQEKDVKQYTKDEVSKIIKGKKLDDKVAASLEREITNELLDDAMKANKTVYEKKMDVLLKAASAMVRTAEEGIKARDARLRYRLSKMRR